MKLTTRLTVSLILLSTVPLILVSALTFRSTSQTLEAQELDELSIITSLLIITAGIGLLVGVFSLGFAQSLVRPISRLVEGAHRIGAGDLSHRVDVDLAAALSRGQIPSYSLEKRYICKDGTHLWVNLPRMNGKEVLAEIKQDRSLRRILVVVLTTSDGEDDVQGAYDLHANCYIIKPLGLEQFITAVQAIESFWLALVKLPAGE